MDRFKTILRMVGFIILKRQASVDKLILTSINNTSFFIPNFSNSRQFDLTNFSVFIPNKTQTVNNIH